MKDWRDIPIEDMELSTRAYNCLKYSSDIRTAEQLAAATDAELLKIDNLGRKTLRELREALAESQLGPTAPYLEAQQPPASSLDPSMLDWVLAHQELITILMHGTTIAQVQIIIPVEQTPARPGSSAAS